jgi:hypothetical protein
MCASVHASIIYVQIWNFIFLYLVKICVLGKNCMKQSLDDENNFSNGYYVLFFQVLQRFYIVSLR